MRIKWLIPGFIGIITLFYLLLWQPASMTFIDWYLGFQCRKSWGVEFSHSGIVKEGDRWIVSAPALVQDNQISGATFDAKARSLEFSYVFRPFSWELGIEIRVIEPLIVVKESDVDWNGFLMEQSRFGPLVRLSPKVNIDRGQIVFVRETGSTKPLYFDFFLDLMDARNGGLTAYLDPNDQEHNRLNIDIRKLKRKNYQAVVHIQELDLSTLVEAGKTLMPYWMDWDIESGIVDGSIDVHFGRGKKPHYSGSIGCKNLQFNHEYSEISGVFPEISFTYQENGKCWSCDIPDRGNVSIAKDKAAFWTFNDIQGGIDWTPNSKTVMVLKARCSHDDIEQELIVEGGGFFEEQHQETVSLAFCLGQGDESAMKTRLFYRHLGEQKQSVELEISRLQPDTFALARHLFGFYQTNWKAVELDKGSINAALTAFIEQGQVTDIKIEHLHAENVQCTVHPLETAFHAEMITGQAQMKAQASNILHTLDATLKIGNGGVRFLGPEEWQMDEIVTEIVVQQGVIQPSTFSAALGGLKGTITLDGTAQNRLFRGYFEGQMQGVSALGSLAFEKGIAARFAEDHLALLINLSRYEGGIQLEGSAVIAQTETIHFGCSLVKQKEEDWASCRYGRQSEEEGGYRFSIWDQELRFAGFRVADGWFNGVELPLDKYITPFFLQDTGFKLTGCGDFQGGFNHETLSVKYDARDLCIESDKFEIHVPELATENWAIQVYSLTTGEAEGIIPIKDGSFFDKKTGLKFTGINANIHVDNAGLQVRGIETFSNGIFFGGNIDVTADYAIDIKIDNVNGRLSQMRDLLAHFTTADFLSQIPLEGQISHRAPGGSLSYTPSVEGGVWQAKLSWALVDGLLAVESRNLKLEELQANIHFDLQKRMIELSDLQGTLLVGKPHHVEEYLIAADRIHFSDYTRNEGAFDLWVGDKKRDVIRLVGSSLQTPQGEIGIVLDKEKSHFGDVHPTEFLLTLQDWTTPGHFQIELELDLKTLFYDLQKLGRTKLLPISPSIIDRFEEWKSGQGCFNIALEYERLRSTFTYAVSGKEIAVDEWKFNEIKLNGKSQNHQWSIDELRVDDWSMTAGVTPKEDYLDIHYLGARLGDAMLLGIQGTYDFDKRFFDGSVNLLELDVALLEKYPRFKERLSQLELKGQIKASGKVTIEADKKHPCVDALLDMEMKNWGVAGFEYADIDDVSCHFTSNRGITVRRVNTSLARTQTRFNLERFDYNFINDEISFEGLDFSIPAYELAGLAKQLQPFLGEGEFLSTLSTLKTDGILKGSLDLDITSPHFALRARLDEGTYRYHNQDYSVKNLTFDYDPCELHLCTQYQWDTQWFWIHILTRTPAHDHGEMIIGLTPPDLQSKNVPLTVHWRKDKYVYFERVFGELPGLEFDLVRDTNKEPDAKNIFLEGEIRVDGQGILPLVANEVKTALQEWNIGSGYMIKGKWTIQSPVRTGDKNQLFFHGDLLGADFFCKGYQFDHLAAKVDAAPTYITLRSLELTDSCGVVYADRTEIFLDQNQKWQLSLPYLKINEFQPSLLREMGTVYAPVRKALTINSIVLEDLRGELADSHTFMGGGKLQFSNPTRKNHGNNILAIPVEIIRRIGLDTKILTPVRGTINYTIKDNKIFLTQFKDVFSEGKLSRFFLADNDNKSYIDFKGNLNIQLKMKQNNLIFKLTELFIVSVNGTLLEPIYSMHKQSRERDFFAPLNSK